MRPALRRDEPVPVFYQFSLDTRKVWVLGIGVKDRDRLFIAGEEIEL